MGRDVADVFASVRVSSLVLAFPPGASLFFRDFLEDSGGFWQLAWTCDGAHHAHAGRIGICTKKCVRFVHHHCYCPA